MTRDLTALLRLLDDRDALSALAPSLTITDASVALRVPTTSSVLDDLRTEGYAVLAGVVDATTCDALARGAAALTRAGVPPLFLLAFDELWSGVFAVASAASSAMGRTMVPIPDLWAWYLEATPGARGWSPHRGVYDDVRDEEGIPTLVNVWIPLRDAEPENGCMVVVPQDLDPGFPTSKKIEDTPLDRARAVPAAAGSMVFWGANVLHWGGTIGRRARAPRSAFSVSLRSGAPRDALLATPTFRQRIDLAAELVHTYGHLDPTLGPVVEWARAVGGMDLARRKFSRRPPTP